MCKKLIFVPRNEKFSYFLVSPIINRIYIHITKLFIVGTFVCIFMLYIEAKRMNLNRKRLLLTAVMN